MFMARMVSVTVCETGAEIATAETAAAAVLAVKSAVLVAHAAAMAAVRQHVPCHQCRR